jgi:hypothetical protein
MIEKDFSGYPPKLWITLWESCGHRRQVLDSASGQWACPIWQQVDILFKIKYLARNPLLLDASAAHGATTRRPAPLLGISQALMTIFRNLRNARAGPVGQGFGRG